VAPRHQPGGQTNEPTHTAENRRHAAAAIISSRARAEVVKLKVGHVDPPTSYSGVGLEAFAKEVESRSNGEMHVDVFHAGALGAIPDEMKNVFAGAQDMHLLFPEFTSGIVDQGKLISAPYLFRDQKHLQLYYKSDVFKPAVDRFQQLGAILLDPGWTWWIKDPRGLLSTRPMLTRGDLKGHKVRLWEDKTAIETWRGLGNVIVIPHPQLYLALKQGLIEAAPETISTAYDTKDDEVGKYSTRTDEYFQIINIMMNERKFKSLTSAQQKVLTDATAAAAAALTNESLRGFTDKKDRARSEQAVTIIEPNPGPWREKGAQVLAKLKADGTVPKDLADRAAALT
jgi:TRAP-type C4-dicarboxylate transport system substrate-binding protein